MSMPSYCRSTTREEMVAVVEERKPGEDENLLEYNLFLTDGFGPRTKLTFMNNSTASPEQIDGFYNDDSYRASRHLVNRYDGLVDIDNSEQRYRENSLARQLQDKEERPATIRLIRRREAKEINHNSYGPQLPWVNVIPPNTKFFLERVQENREEKVQVMDTFGEFVAFFFGRRPEVYSYSGTLLNAKNHDWKNDFLENYEYFLRGSQAVKYRATMVMQYDDVIVEGYMLNCQIQQEATMDKAVPFSFNLLVLNRSPLNPRNMLSQRFERSSATRAEAEIFNSLQEMLNLTKTDRIDELDTYLLMREYFSGNYVPAAGTASQWQDATNINSSANGPPGVSGGTNSETPASGTFDSTLTTKVADSGVRIA